MKTGNIAFSTAIKTRKFVKNIASEISKGHEVSPKDMLVYETFQDGVKFSKNPIKNLFNFFSTKKQIQNEINFAVNEAFSHHPAIVQPSKKMALMNQLM